MGRLKGLGSFVVIAAAVLLALRGLHLAVPLFVTNARPGPFELSTIDEVERYAGFAPMLPAYRPISLGERPARLTVWLIPYPTLAINWKGEHSLSLTQRRGGSMPDHPGVTQPLADVPDSQWWQDGPRAHLILKRGDFWFELETDLDARELQRFANTLTPY